VEKWDRAGGVVGGATRIGPCPAKVLYEWALGPVTAVLRRAEPLPT